MFLLVFDKTLKKKKKDNSKPLSSSNPTSQTHQRQWRFLLEQPSPPFYASKRRHSAANRTLRLSGYPLTRLNHAWWCERYQHLLNPHQPIRECHAASRSLDKCPRRCRTSSGFRRSLAHKPLSVFGLTSRKMTFKTHRTRGIYCVMRS